MSPSPLDGVRVLEVAQFTFVPSAGAVLADWGADVVKIEHPVTGDAQRGLVRVLGAAATIPGSSFAPIMEAPNRGKRSVGLALDNPDARPLLEELIRRSDVFLTNYLAVRTYQVGHRRRRRSQCQSGHHLCRRQRIRLGGARPRHRRL